MSNNKDNIKDNDIVLLINELNGINNTHEFDLDLNNNIMNKKKYLNENNISKSKSKLDMEDIYESNFDKDKIVV